MYHTARLKPENENLVLQNYLIMLTRITAVMMKCREVMEKRSTELKGAE